MAKYAKVLASFANAKGGSIVFGVRDHPREIVGVDADLFDSTPVEKIQEALSSFLSPELNWELSSILVADRTLGILNVSECADKPVICKTNKGSDLKNGDIYYRYRGQSKVIEFAELKQIHLEIRDRERALWMQHIERIGRIGPRNVAFMDLLDGSIESDALNSRLIIDRELLDQLKSEVTFIEAGKFSESDGGPTLRLVGEVQSSDQIIVPSMEPERDYPYLATTLADELQIRSYDVQILIWKLQLKGNPRYHARISTSRRGGVDKYSRFALRELQNLVFEHKDEKAEFLKVLSSEYQAARAR